MLNNSEIGFSVAIFCKELHVSQLRIRPATEICSLCKIQILQALIRTAGLFQKPAHDVRGINIGRVKDIPTFFSAHI